MARWTQNGKSERHVIRSGTRGQRLIKREGGIYLDTDVYVLKAFSELLNNPKDTILGHEGGNRYGLCNAVIIARPGSEFIAKWWETYESFNDRNWNKHSVLVPKQLSVKYPELVCALSPTAFFWPTWAKSHVHFMHEIINEEEVAQMEASLTQFGGAMYENQLAYHATGGYHNGYFVGLTPDDILNKDTRFNLLVRDIYITPI